MEIDITRRVFWPAYLSPFIEREHDDGAADWVDPLASLFRVDPRALDEEFEALHRTEHKRSFVPDPNDEAVWAEVDTQLAKMGVSNSAIRSEVGRHVGWALRGPKNRELAISLSDDWRWVMELDPSPGCYHRIEHPELDTPLPIGCSDAHHRLPGLMYGEARALAARAVDASAVHVALLLMPLSSPGPEDVVSECREWIAELLSEVVPADAVPELARRFYIPDYCRWSHDDRLGWINDSTHSYRNPSDYSGREWAERDGFTWFARFCEACQLPRIKRARRD